MSWRYYALFAALAFWHSGSAGAQATFAPETGVLILKNGQVIDGQITKAGDYYVLSKGEGSELRLKIDEVELCCASLLEAYEFKQRHVTGYSAKGHLDLAKWCLRNQLLEQCTLQLAAAERLEPTSREVKELHSRLTMAQETPQPAASHVPAQAIAPDEVEKALRDLPRGSIERFGAVVQPILLNRCGAVNQCHGPNAKSEFRLLRPPPGQITSRRFTQRNLYASLRYLDAANPDASPLVLMPQKRHGNSLAPVFDKNSANQLAELTTWARITLSGSSSSVSAPPSGPATIAPSPALLSQAAGAVASAKPAAESPPPSTPLEELRALRATKEAAAGIEPAKVTSGFTPRDRFDPEIFNRRYHAK